MRAAQELPPGIMPDLDTSLAAAAGAMALLWAALVLYVGRIDRLRTAARRQIAEVLATLDSAAVRGLPARDRLERVRPLLDRCSRELLMHTAARPDTGDDTFDVLARYLGERWTGILEQDAAAHRTARDKWRRMTAFRILFRLDHPSTLRLLARALDEHDTEIADVGLELLGRSTDARAIDILLDALKSRRQPASVVARHIDESPQRLADRLIALLAEDDATLRFWGASLLARYPGHDVEAAVARLIDDADPRVRKAALQTLGAIGETLAVDAALRKLDDPVPYVRAHAARALGELDATEHAPRIVPLLGDRDWWTRLAARQALEALGSEIWPILMRSLTDADRFVRNGAAEVLQNIGVLDSLIVMEAASDAPAPAKVEMLRRITAAGGLRFTDSLIERAGPKIGPRIKALLNTIGFAHVGAA